MQTGRPVRGRIFHCLPLTLALNLSRHVHNLAGIFFKKKGFGIVTTTV